MLLCFELRSSQRRRLESKIEDKFRIFHSHKIREGMGEMSEFFVLIDISLYL